ncbi:MAG: putative toxin-antitoxin system toxin component, PIN family [Paludibacteraceae bacterium]|nr:putative toxin-antitoxin system toxin component, PIN family [Paludibacteraceae bacterium]
MENIVLDTNCLIPSIKRDSIYFPIWEGFMRNKYCLCFTDEILNEYEEIIALRTGSPEVAQNIIRAILNRTNTKHIKVYFRFGLIEADPDDNKFVDCAIKANAKYIVSEDHHFDVLKTIDFPSVNVIGINDFLQELQSLA